MVTKVLSKILVQLWFYQKVGQQQIPLSVTQLKRKVMIHVIKKKKIKSSGILFISDAFIICQNPKGKLEHFFCANGNKYPWNCKKINRATIFPRSKFHKWNLFIQGNLCESKIKKEITKFCNKLSMR